MNTQNWESDGHHQKVEYSSRWGNCFGSWRLLIRIPIGNVQKLCLSQIKVLVLFIGSLWCDLLFFMFASSQFDDFFLVWMVVVVVIVWVYVWNFLGLNFPVHLSSKLLREKKNRINQDVWDTKDSGNEERETEEHKAVYKLCVLSQANTIQKEVTRRMNYLYDRNGI